VLVKSPGSPFIFSVFFEVSSSVCPLSGGIVQTSVLGFFSSHYTPSPWTSSFSEIGAADYKPMPAKHSSSLSPGLQVCIFICLVNTFTVRETQHMGKNLSIGVRPMRVAGSAI